jgi:hypothetical protein
MFLIDMAQKLNRHERKPKSIVLQYAFIERVLLVIVIVGQLEVAEKIRVFLSLRSPLVSYVVPESTRDETELTIYFLWSIRPMTPPSPRSRLKLSPCRHARAWMHTYAHIRHLQPEGRRQ